MMQLQVGGKGRFGNVLDQHFGWALSVSVVIWDRDGDLSRAWVRGRLEINECLGAKREPRWRGFGGARGLIA